MIQKTDILTVGQLKSMLTKYPDNWGVLIDSDTFEEPYPLVDKHRIHKVGEDNYIVLHELDTEAENIIYGTTNNTLKSLFNITVGDYVEFIEEESARIGRVVDIEDDLYIIMYYHSLEFGIVKIKLPYIRLTPLHLKPHKD